MDLLCRAYAGDSDNDGSGEDLAAPVPKRIRSEAYESVRSRPPNPSEIYSQHSRPPPVIHHGSRPSWGPTQVEASAATAPATTSRYVSKRERAILAASASISGPSPPPTTTASVASPVVGTISDSDIPYDVLVLLKHQFNVRSQNTKVPGRLSVVLNGHSKPVNSIQWSPSHGHLLASAGMDQIVYVWNVWNICEKKSRVFKFHNAAVKDVRWSPQGLSLLSCGYDCSSRLVDVEMGIETQLFKEDQVVEAIRFLPHDSNLFLSGGDKGFLRLWDIRAGKVAQEYHRSLGPILDIEFRADGKHFISSSDISQSSISENSIIVWDVSRQVPLSNQVYVEAYTCPCIRYHPTESCFVAQSNGNYIAIFSARPPFKLDRYKRYEKHGVWGYPIKCNFSLDGKILASGSSDGYMYLYKYRSSELLRKIKAFEQACVDVAFHPLMPNVVASCSWTGDVSVFDLN